VQERFPGKPAVFLPETIEAQCFRVHKEHTDAGPVRLLYSGYAAKAGQLYLIRDVIERLGERFPLEILCVSERDPELTFRNVPTRFLRHIQRRFARTLLDGDIKIAPRDLNEPYNWGHSFSKVGYPMACGLPVVASPVDSYKCSPAILCESLEDWERALTRLIESAPERTRLAAEGTEYCRANFSLPVVGARYEAFFDRLLGRQVDCA
jgi:hypothetical protein